MRAIYLAWMLGIAGGQSTNAQSTPKEVIPVATPVQCFSRHEGWIATSVGPCEGFGSPEPDCCRGDVQCKRPELGESKLSPQSNLTRIGLTRGSQCAKVNGLAQPRNRRWI